MEKTLKCPNCNAVLTSHVCEYCGAKVFDLADMELNKAGYLRIKFNNQIIAIKAIPIEMEIVQTIDARPVIRMEFIAMANEKGIVFEKQKVL